MSKGDGPRAMAGAILGLAIALGCIAIGLWIAGIAGIQLPWQQ